MNREWLKQNPLTPAAEILIIAGDTYDLNREYRNLDFIQRVSDEFEMTYLIPGNHEYYGGVDAASALESTCEAIRENVIMLNNQVVEIEGIRFIFSTMWTDIRKNMLEVMRGMADFSKINFRGKPFRIKHYNLLHEKSYAFIEQEVSKPGRKVVVTHHLPSEQCNVEEFQDSLINVGFCVDKTELIQRSDIDCWIYGHSHRNKADFDINGTRMVTNQLGYVGWQEHVSFNRSCVVELG